MKYFTPVILGFVALLAICDAGTIQTQFGVISQGDTLLHRESVVRESTFLRKTVVDYSWPPPNQLQQYMISAIVVHDQHDDKGDVSIKHGGIGSRNVIIHLKSARNHGMNFIVEIYGKRL